MNEIECDRCKKQLSIGRSWKITHQWYGNDREYYVCLKCFRKIEKFIRGEIK